MTFLQRQVMAMVNLNPNENENFRTNKTWLVSQFAFLYTIENIVKIL